MIILSSHVCVCVMWIIDEKIKKMTPTAGIEPATT